jgi:hypothetical protein
LSSLLFLGSNIDAISTAARFGIDEDFAVEYNTDHIGTQLIYEAVNEVVINLRSGKKIDRSLGFFSARTNKQAPSIIKNFKQF